MRREIRVRTKKPERREIIKVIRIKNEIRTKLHM